MNQDSRSLEYKETTNPQHKQDDRKYEKHYRYLFLFTIQTARYMG
jgi:hypothetical protein